MSQSHGTALFREPANSGATSPLVFGRLVNAPVNFALDWNYGDPVPAGLVFTGDANRTMLDSSGVVHTVATNVPRNNGYVYDSNGLLVPGWLMEDTSENYLFPSDCSAAISVHGATITTNAVAGPDGVVNAIKVDWTSVRNATAGCLIGANATGTATCMSAWIRADVAGTINLNEGNTGTSLKTVNVTTAWRRFFCPTPRTLGTYLYIYDAGTGVSPAYVYVAWGQTEPGSVPTSNIKTTTGPVTRGAEVAYAPWLYAPGALTMYAKGVNQGTFNLTGGAKGSLISIGGGSGDSTLVEMYTNAAGSLQGFSGQAGGVVFETLGDAPNWGDTFEARMPVDTSGALQLGATINGGAESVSSLSGGQAFAPAYSRPNIYFNNGNGFFIGFAAYQSIRVVNGGAYSLAQMQKAVPILDTNRYTFAKTGTPVGSLVSDGHGGYTITRGNLAGTGRTLFFGDSAKVV